MIVKTQSTRGVRIGAAAFVLVNEMTRESERAREPPSPAARTGTRTVDGDCA
jgi:hypothetical protein